VTDPVILARLTDGTVFVAKAGPPAATPARGAPRSSPRRRVNVLGCVVNDLDVAKHSRYGYYYYYYSRYGSYYAAEDKAAVARPPAAPAGLTRAPSSDDSRRRPSVASERWAASRIRTTWAPSSVLSGRRLASRTR
jgi:hypothetical protein